MSSLKEHFRPEFLNRLDEIIMFDILSPEAIRNIVDVQIDIVRKRLAEKEIELEVADKVLTHLAKKGYNPQYGARPLKRLIQDKILTQVANLMVTSGVSNGGAVLVDEKDGELVITATRKGKSLPTKRKMRGLENVKKEKATA